MKRTFFWVLTILILGACAGTTNIEKMSASCYVRYLAPESALYAEFKLRPENPAGKAIELPAGVRYQGTLMNKLSIPELTYRLEQSGGFAEAQQFDWKDPQQQDHSFKSKMAVIQSFAFEPAVLSTQKPATMQLVGPPLEKGESIVMIWESLVGNLTVSMEVRATAGQQQIDFPASQLAKLTPGEWTLYLVRKKGVSADVDGTPIVGIMEYYSHPDTLTVQ